MAESWINNCINSHEDCVNGETALPSRVLDITSSGDIIKLIDGIGLSGRYASLSYCVSELFLKLHNRSKEDNNS